MKIDAEDTREDGRVLTAAGAMVGSPSYMAPEQIRGLQVGPPADLYALAVVLYEAMTARRLFPVNNYEALLRTTAKRDAPPLLVTGSGEVVPPELNRILQTALAHDPKDRYPDARTMLLAIEQMDMEVRIGPVDLFSDAPGTGTTRRPPELRLVTPVGTTPVAGPPPVVAPPAVVPATAAPPRADPVVDVRPSEGSADAPVLTAPARASFRPGLGAGLYAASAVFAYALTRMLGG